jgi:LPS-assembly lipoprotein
MHKQHATRRPSFPPLLFWARGLAGLMLLAILGACGFHMKGVSPLPFNTIYTNIPANSDFGARLRRAIVAASPSTRFVSEPGQADVRLTQLSNTQSLRDVSINAQGQVDEYELSLHFVFQLTDKNGHLIMAPTTLEAVQEIPYDSTALQAEQGEIGGLFTQMQQSLVDRAVRRMTSPDVIKAYHNPDSLPVTEPGTPAPVNQNNFNPMVPNPLTSPGAAPGSGLY